MPDGKRKRRHSSNPSKRQWYAAHRSQRFRKRFGLCTFLEVREALNGYISSRAIT
jgi:hypothetical protein